MKTLEQIREEFDKLPAKKQVTILYYALDYMQQYNGRSRWKCVSLAMGYEEQCDDNGKSVYFKKQEEK